MVMFVVTGGDMTPRDPALRLPISAVFLGVGGALCGSGSYCLGAPRFELRSPCIELCVGTIFGGLAPAMGLVGPDAPLAGMLVALVLGAGIYLLSEIFGYRLAARILPRRGFVGAEL